MKDYLLGLKNVFNYRGESTIKEFWNFFIINILVSIVILILSKKYLSTELPSDIFRYLSLIPFYSLGFRRLKNAGYSGWLFLIPIVNLILASLPSKEIKNN